MRPKRTAALLALILVLACALRLINLGGRSLWYDEAFAVLFAETGLDAMLYGTLTPVAGGAADIHPLLYYVSLDGWMSLFGQSPVAVRLWSAVLGVATVGLMFVLGRDLFGERTGLTAALITAVAPFHVQYSQETRMYALLGLLLVAATICFVRAWRSADSRRWLGWGLFGVLAGLAMYTQQLAAFYLVALALVPLLARQPKPLAGVISGGVIAVVIYLPWLVNLPGQLNKVRSYYWLNPPNAAQPLLTLRSFLVVNLDISAPGSLIGFLSALFIALFLLIQVVLFLRRRRARNHRHALLLVLWLAAAPPALMWLVSQVQPVYLERALLPSALMLYLALAWLFTQGGLPRPIVALVGGVGLVLVGIGLTAHYSWATFPNSPFDRATVYIRDHWQAGDVVVHQNKLTALPMMYYGRDLTQRYLGDLPGSSQDTLALPTQETLGLLADTCVQAAAQGSRVWWTVFDFAADQYAAVNRTDYADAVNWLDAHFIQADAQRFNDLDIILYTDPDTGAQAADCR
ncbi:MAG: glycosyltransferase family 39 protein [Anaerolineae bacterium]|nr:glycosyltransferase family 39 protein [Anaerolineae bacterium]